MDGKRIDFRLTDYLKPRGIYPYDSLAPTMETFRENGYTVVLIAVAGFVYLVGHPGNSARPWTNNGQSYKTAADGLAVRNGRSHG